jgi:hypothetical protein
MNMLSEIVLEHVEGSSVNRGRDVDLNLSRIILISSTFIVQLLLGYIVWNILSNSNTRIPVSPPIIMAHW